MRCKGRNGEPHVLPRLGTVGHQDPRWSHQSCNDRSDLWQHGAGRCAAFSNEARDFARPIQANLGLEPMENPFLDDNERLTPPAEYETRLRRALPRWQTHYTSDD